MMNTAMGLRVLILAIAMGAAGQNIVFAIFSLISLISFNWKQRPFANNSSEINELLSYRRTYLLFWLWAVVSDVIFHGHGIWDSFSEMAGWLTPLILPSIVAGHINQGRDLQFGKLVVFTKFFFGLLGLLALSQLVWSWQFFDGQLQSRGYRAYGFHSHPLTFAYSIMLFAPLMWAGVVEARRKISIFGFLGMTLAILASLSRTVQAVFGLQLLWDILSNRPPVLRRRLLLCVFIGALVMGITDNPVKQKIIRTIAGVEDVHSQYPDDRLAFWHAHWQLIKAKPIIGHGAQMSSEVRADAYAQIGLADFQKQYAAHNTFIQVWAEMGLVGLILYLAFIVQLLSTVWRYSRQDSTFKPYLYGFVGFWVACLTQNGFQDSEVRGTFAVLLCFMIVHCSTRKNVESQARI